MTIRAREAVVAKFLRKALAGGALAVPKLEMMARAAGLLGEGQDITQAKSFRRAKKSLEIRSVRDGFGVGGRWAWRPPVFQATARFLCTGEDCVTHTGTFSTRTPYPTRVDRGSCPAEGRPATA